MKRKPSRAAVAFCAMATAVLPITTGMVVAAPAYADVIVGAITNATVVQTTAAQFTNVRINLDWRVPNGTQAGDTFTLTLGPPSLWDGIVSSGFNLVDPDTGQVVARATVSGRTVTFTMTAYAESHANVNGSAFFFAKIARDADLGNNPITLTTDGPDFTDTINVTAGQSVGENQKQGGIEPDGPDADNLPDGMAWRIDTSFAERAQTVHIVDTPVAPLTIDCSSIEVRRGTQPTGGTIVNGAVTSCTPTRLVVDVPVTAGQKVSVFGLSPFPAGAQAGDRFTNNMTVTIDGSPHSDSTFVIYPDQGGTGEGDQWVEVGNYVWVDADHDGVQDGSEQGIPNVGLTITRTDGQPVRDFNGNPYTTTTTTDANGLYTFDELQVLPAGVHYVVAINQATVPDGYLPTLTGQGTTATDSSTGSAESTDLTTLGDSDMTLDFGFWQPAPDIDIEKADEAGNDADTQGDAVDLGSAPGATGIVYTITNNGTEDLTQVDVSDVVLANGTISNLDCTFPDGSHGTLFTGTFRVDASFTCTADLAGVAVGTDHQNRGSVTAEGVVSGIPVDDSDDYWANVSAPAEVSVGDYVWIDANHNGAQEPGEVGIAGVELSVTRSDGQPALNADGTTPGVATTNGSGFYLFDGLAVLPAGVHYVVTLDASTVPAGYFPTLENVGPAATDSSTGSEESTDLTTDGASDLTLDFGFWQPAPDIDIEKADEAGNDADVVGDSVDLGTAPGATGIVYTITNNGTEDLTQVDVSDVVLANGTVSNLDCTFPDGSTGTLFTGTFAVGASFTCTADLAGVATGADHQNRGSVTAEGVVSGTPAEDSDDYFAHVSNAPVVSVGDYVWFDKDHDGIQETGEVGIEGVELSVSRSDGQPAMNADGSVPGIATTDATGLYSFTGLEVLPAGVHYVVTLDASTVPADYLPTVTGAGTPATDSSTGSAESTDLTTDGASDLTLDFGFWKEDTVIVQVDQYGWGPAVGKKPSVKYGQKIARMDNDGKLMFGEDFWVGAKWVKESFPYTSKKSYVFEVKVPAGSTNAQIARAASRIAVSKGFAPFKTTAKLGDKVKASGKVTDYFQLGKGAYIGKVFGPNNNIPQKYLGRG